MNEEMNGSIAYQGTKRVNAMPMTLGEYKQQTERNPYAGSEITLPDSEPGYLVRYKDGYKSWSPKYAFDEAYRPCDTYIDRMHIELGELNERRRKLAVWLAEMTYTVKSSKETTNIEQAQKQYEAMTSYANALQYRLWVAEAQE